jgi:hypothetical protein
MGTTATTQKHKVVFAGRAHNLQANGNVIPCKQ